MKKFCWFFFCNSVWNLSLPHISHVLLLFLPSSMWVLVCVMPHFQAHQPVSPLQWVSPDLWCAVFPSSITHFSLFLHSSKWVLVCDVPHFKAYQPAPFSFSPPGNESSFVLCHVFKLTNLFLPVSPSSKWVIVCDMPCSQAHQWWPTHSSLPPSSWWVLICVMPHLQAHQPVPPLQQVSCHLWHAMFLSSITCSSLFLPSRKWWRWIA
jgi:hypothetical protein